MRVLQQAGCQGRALLLGRCRQRAYRLRRGAAPRWKRPEALEFLPDLQRDDWDKNLRSMVVQWLGDAGHIETLLDEGREFEYRFPEDAAAIKSGLREAEQLARRVRKVGGTPKPYDPHPSATPIPEETPAADGLRLKPISLPEARNFVAAHHRHSRVPVGHKFSIGLVNGEDDLVGVAMTSRPVARALNDGWTAEVSRRCVLDGARNANSMLYGACWRAAKGMGYVRLVSYTRQDETGASLRAAGFVKVKELPARKSWAESSTGRERQRRHPVGDGGVARVLWEIRTG